MDLSVLPTFCALTVFVCCFLPLVRRAGPHTNIWFVGWAFLLVHYGAVLLPDGTGLRAELTDLVGLWSSELCGLSFLLVSSNTWLTRSNRLLALTFLVPVLLQSYLAAFGVRSFAPHCVSDLLLLAPAAYLLLVVRARTRAGNQLAGIFAALALVELVLPRTVPYAAVATMDCVIFLSAAYMNWINANRVTRGVWLMSVGLVTWALGYLVQLSSWLGTDSRLSYTVLDVPRYIAAAGMILMLLDECFHLAESMALHDPMTGLPNRRLFDIRLDQAIQECRVTQTPVACLVIDVDKFKYINDTFGHPVGDGLLQALAKRLSWNLGPRDMLARTGGDEFTAILVEAADEHHVRFIAGAMMAAGCVPVSIQQHLIDVRISIGIAVAPRDANEKAELHRVADEAMYRAKRRGGGGVAFAHEEMAEIHAV